MHRLFEGQILVNTRIYSRRAKRGIILSCTCEDPAEFLYLGESFGQEALMACINCENRIMTVRMPKTDNLTPILDCLPNSDAQLLLWHLSQTQIIHNGFLYPIFLRGNGPMAEYLGITEPDDQEVLFKINLKAADHLITEKFINEVSVRSIRYQAVHSRLQRCVSVEAFDKIALTKSTPESIQAVIYLADNWEKLKLNRMEIIQWLQKRASLDPSKELGMSLRFLPHECERAIRKYSQINEKRCPTPLKKVFNRAYEVLY